MQNRSLRSVLSIVLIAFYITMAACDMPCPFTRQLSVQNPPLEGGDVYILQNLLRRSPLVGTGLPLSYKFDKITSMALADFQNGNGLPSTGILDRATSLVVLDQLIDDGYRDNGTIPAGYMYKLHVPVHRDRTIEVTATLYDSKMNILHQFTVRAHGQNDPVTGEAYNQFCPSGSTPTGLMTFDLNSPEDDWNSYGPYPINRAVNGLEGNGGIVISNIRDGILLHTCPGEWPSWNVNQNASQPMINSEGCLHAHPPDILKVWQVLTAIGVQMRPNTDGALPYPYPQQGILSIEQID